MNTYDANQLSSLSICTGCRKAFYLPNIKICDTCKSRCETKRREVQTIRLQNLCERENCKYKKSGDTSYCKLHKVYIWIDQVKASGKIPCTQYKRGCRNVLEPNGDFTRCESCRKAEREKDKAKRDQARTQNAENTSHDTKVCTTCGKTHNRDAFIGERSVETLTCIHCRNNGKIQDRKRDQEHRRIQGRIYDSTEARKKQKKEWQKNNWDKVVRAWKKYREKQRAKDKNAFLKKNAENAKQWRQNNPAAVKEINARKKENINSQYAVYIQSSKHRNIQFELTVDEYKSIAQNPCYYCGTVNEKRGFNGIDRVDNSLGYNMDNCVASCSMCNYMKGTLQRHHFLQRIEHILTFSGLIQGNLFEESFRNYKGNSFNDYIRGAKKRNLYFELSEQDFNRIKSEICYLCGKTNTINHKNGIDRVNSSIGYILENCKPCCGGCNYMKLHFETDSWFSKLQKIFSHQNNQISIL